MSDVYQTIERYEAVCKEFSIPPSPFIRVVLEKEKERCILDVPDSMSLLLAGNNHLLTKKRLEDQDALVLFHTLKNNTYVTSLDLRYNNITDMGAELLANLALESPNLKELNVMCNDLTEKGAAHLAKALHTNETLNHMRLNGNKMGNKGGMYFAQALQINTTLEALDLGDTDLEIEAVVALSTVLTQNRTLKALNVNRPLLFTHQEETTVQMAKMLKMNTVLQELHLQKYDMRDFGVTRLAENLMHNSALKYLDLSCNRITRDGAKELAKLLKENTGLKVLDLGFNRLEDDGAKYLAEALKFANHKLTTLVVTSNNISGPGLCALADSMENNMTLNNIYIWGNNLEEPACDAFAGLIDTGRLELKNTDVKPYIVDGVTYLSELSHGIRRWYYWTPFYGDDVPEKP